MTRVPRRSVLIEIARLRRCGFVVGAWMLRELLGEREAQRARLVELAHERDELVLRTRRKCVKG